MNVEIILAYESDYKLMTFVFIVDDAVLGLVVQDAFRTVGRPFFNERTFIQFLFVETNLSLPYLFVILSFVTSVFELVTVDQLGIQDTFTTESRRGITVTRSDLRASMTRSAVCLSRGISLTGTDARLLWRIISVSER